jgi:hypothetical protein
MRLVTATATLYHVFVLYETNEVGMDQAWSAMSMAQGVEW